MADDTEQAGDTGTGEQTLDDRMGHLEEEQARQGGMLEQIIEQLRGTEGEAHAAAQAHTQERLAHPPAETIAAQVRQAVADVDAERERRAAAAAHDADHEQIRRDAERRPRELASGWRGRLQAAMFGQPE